MRSASALFKIGFVFGLATWSPTSAWEVVQTGTTANLRSLQFIGADTGYVFGDAGVYLKTTDGGTTWTKPAFPATSNLGPAHFVTGQSGWVVSGGDSLYRTTNGGNTWAFLFKADADIRSLYFLNADTGIATRVLYDTLHVMRSIDGGASWSTRLKIHLLLTASGRPYSSIRFSTTGTGWILVGVVRLASSAGGISTQEYGWILKTQDRGATWSDSSTNAAWTGATFPGNERGWILSSYMGSSPGCGHVWCPGGNYNALRINRTTDGGATWVQQENSTAAAGILNSIQFFGSDTGYMVGIGGLVMKTTDGGATWPWEIATSGKTLHDVHIVSPTTAFAVGDTGTLVKVNPAVPVSIHASLPAKTIETFARVSDNVLHYHLPYVAEVSVTLRDLRGKSLWHRKSFEAPGKRSLFLPLQSLPPGSYALEFRAGGLRETFSIPIR